MQPQWQGDLGRNLIVFVLGFLMIFIGIFLAKKLKVIGGTLVSKEDRRLIEKTKRALGIGGNQSTPTHHHYSNGSGPTNNDMHPFGSQHYHHQAMDSPTTTSNLPHQHQRNPGTVYPSSSSCSKSRRNEPVSVGGAESPENLKDTLLGTL